MFYRDSVTACNENLYTGLEESILFCVLFCLFFINLFYFWDQIFEWKTLEKLTAMFTIFKFSIFYFLTAIENILI